MRRMNTGGLGYYSTVLVFMILGAVVGTIIGTAFGWLGKEVGWWGVGLILGLIYGTITGVSVADRA